MFWNIDSYIPQCHLKKLKQRGRYQKTFCTCNYGATTLSIVGLFVKLSITVIMLSVAIFYDECRYAECHYAQCRYAQCRYAECRYAECHCAECRYAECHCAECRNAVISGIFQFSQTGNEPGTFFHLFSFASPLSYSGFQHLCLIVWQIVTLWMGKKVWRLKEFLG